MPSEIFVSHSLNRHFAALLKSQLSGRLAAQGLDAFVAEEDLSEGIRWRPEIFRRLDGCVGAVLLLTRHSVGRPWVRFESSILLHRAALHGIPIILTLEIADPGDALPERALRWLEPGQIREYQSQKLELRLPARDLDEPAVRRDFQAAAERLAEVVQNSFAALRPREVNSSLNVWYGDVAALLPDRPELAPRLRAALAELCAGIDDSNLRTIDDLRAALAHELIVAPPGPALRAFSRLQNSPGLDARALFDRVQLTQVSPRTAERVANACRAEDEERRTVFVSCVVLDVAAEAIPAAERLEPAVAPEAGMGAFVRVANFLLQRAYGADTQFDLIPLTGRTGEAVDQELADAARRALHSHAFTLKPESLRASPVKYVFLIPCPRAAGGMLDLLAGDRYAGVLTRLVASVPRLAMGNRTPVALPLQSTAGHPCVLLDETSSLEQEEALRLQYRQVEATLRR